MSLKRVDLIKNSNEKFIVAVPTNILKDEIYKNIEKVKSFESEKNKLVYDTEIEAIYIIGEFGVKTDGIWEKIDRNAVRYSGAFSIISQPEKLKLNLRS